MVKPWQIEAALGLLQWKRKDLADKSGVTPNTITRILSGGNYTAETMDKIVATLEAHGVEFIPRGVRRKQSE